MAIPIPIEVPTDDIQLNSMTPGQNEILCSQVIPEISVENKGTNPITEITVNYTIEGGVSANYTWTGTLASKATRTITLPAIAATPGKNKLKTIISISNDSYSDNNKLSSDFYINGIVNARIINTFEFDTDALITFNEGGGAPLWERGIPTGTKLNTVASGTQAYGTNLDGDHPNNTKAFLISKCYQFSSITSPILKFKMAYELENNWDIVYVEYSINSGSTWNVLGTKNSLPKWYNSDRTNATSGAANDCQNCPGKQWTGTNATMTEYAYDFTANAANGETDLRNEDSVIFRIVFHSDPGTVEEGVVIDDLVVEGFQDDDDDDNDGILDVNDNCPLVANANQLDTNNDGEGDVCDTDDDGDGILDTIDNCPLVANADQADNDNDGIGNVCDDDMDNDGVPNASDTCNNTPVNAVVDVNGCEVFSLPISNFKIQTIGESCVSSNNGSINITAETSFTYSANLKGSETTIDNAFTTSTNFTNLEAGTYKVCITLAEQPTYSQCFDVIITEPAELAVFSKIGNDGKSISLDLSGGELYTIVLNGTTYKTSDNTITLPLTRTTNSLSIKTDKDCQGTHKETFIVASEIFIYPNPVSGGSLNVKLNNLDIDHVEMSLFTITGKQLFKKQYKINNNMVKLDVEALNTGIYLLNVKTNSESLNYKIIRK